MDVVNGAATHGDLTLTWAAASDVGRKRRVNEDAFAVFDGLFIVADGMGGHSAGDVASRLAIEAVERFAPEVPLSLAQLEELVTDANAAVHEHATTEGPEGMGTTLVGVALVENAGDLELAVINVGDSRCYGVRDGEVELLTVDHSLVQELVESGELSVDEAADHPDRNVVTRAIGIEDRVAADFVLLRLDDVARLVLCSDGVSGELAAERLNDLLSDEASGSGVVSNVMEEVLDGPARDNVTLAVIDVDWVGDPSADVTGPRPPTRDLDITAPRAELPVFETMVPADRGELGSAVPATDLITETPVVREAAPARSSAANVLIDAVPPSEETVSVEEEPEHD